MENGKEFKGVPDETSVGLSAASPRPVTGSGLSATIPHASHYAVLDDRGRLMPGATVRLMSRINNDGLSLVPCDEDPHVFDREIVVSRLSITYDTWIARTGMATYIAKVILP